MKLFDCTGAYGRTYKDQASIKADYEAGKDFQSLMGGYRYFSNRDEKLLREDGYNIIRFFSKGVLLYLHALT